jgi:hypothetical protein
MQGPSGAYLVIIGQIWKSSTVFGEPMPTFIDAISVDRLSTYRRWAGQDDALAKRLYTFNVELSAALYGPLHMLEIALRNVADRQLTTRRGIDWMDDADTLPVPYQQTCVVKAREQLVRDRKAVTHSQMIAELNFGFWSSLFGRRSSHLWGIFGRSFRQAAFNVRVSTCSSRTFARCATGLHTTSRFWPCPSPNDMPTSRH